MIQIYGIYCVTSNPYRRFKTLAAAFNNTKLFSSNLNVSFLIKLYLEKTEEHNAI